MSSTSTPAKTVSFSPLRPGHATFKNTLDNPIKLKWPELPSDSIEALMKQLKSCLTGMEQSVSRCNKPQKKRNKKRKKVASEEPSTKKQRLETHKETDKETLQPSPGLPDNNEAQKIEDKESDVSCSQPLQIEADPNTTPTPMSTAAATTLASKRTQLIVGVNAVSRCLERRGLEGLRGGLVCLSAQPALILRHLMMLAATRGVSFVALPNLSQAAAPLLGVKTALAIGFKKVPSDEIDHFSEMVDTISKLAPPINIPWLTVQREQTLKTAGDTAPGDGCGKQQEDERTIAKECGRGEKEKQANKTSVDTKGRAKYLPLQIKRVVTTKERKGKSNTTSLKS